MTLKPLLECPRPAYPEGPPWRRGLLKRLRRVTAVGAALGALWLGGCYGATPMPSTPEGDADIAETSEDDGAPEPDAEPLPEPEPEPEPEPVPEPEPPPAPEPTVCEPDPRMSGLVAPMSYFICEWDDPPPPSDALPVHLGAGQLCAGGAALSWFSVEEPTRLRIGLLDYSEEVLLTVMNGDGSVITTIGPGESCIELDVEPDAVGLAAEPAVSPEPEYGYFEFYVDIVGAEEPEPAS